MQLGMAVWGGEQNVPRFGTITTSHSIQDREEAFVVKAQELWGGRAVQLGF